MTGSAVVAGICVAHVLTMAGVFAFPALIPTFIAEWRLSYAETGWIAGVFFGAYAAAVPVLMAITDRIDARRVYVGGALAAALASAAFAMLADGFWSALALRAIAGVALAATFMPGLKLLIDRYRGSQPSRAIALYTASFSLGTALSFLLAGEAAARWGWRSAFVAAAAAAAGAAVIALLMRPCPPATTDRPGRLFDFRPVLRNRRATAYILAYGIHCCELFSLRAWMVAFLTFSASLPAAGDAAWPAPTTVAMFSGLIAMAASVGGNELCVRFGRVSTIRRIMVVSSLTAAGYGFTAAAGYAPAVIVSLVYTAIVLLDSAALTAGTVSVADPGRQGATIAVHSLVGFAGGFVGPLVLGWVLDLAGGGSATLAWGAAFAVIGIIGLAGPLVLGRAGPGRGEAA